MIWIFQLLVVGKHSVTGFEIQIVRQISVKIGCNLKSQIISDSITGIKAKLLLVSSYRWIVGVTLSIFVYRDRKSTRLNSSHVKISYAVFCLKKKKNNKIQ